MAHAAANSVMDTFEQLSYFSNQFRNFHFPDSLPILLHLLEMAVSILDIDFEEDCPGGGKSLEKEIRVALWKAEDIIESYLSTYFLSSESESWEENEMGHASNFSQHLLLVLQELESAKERREKFVDDNPKHGTKEDSISMFFSSAISPSNNLQPQCKNKIVGLDKELEEIKSSILGASQLYLGAAAIYGMGGIGKTTLAILFYQDSDVREHFSIGAWVKVSLKHCVRDILLSLLCTVEAFNHGRLEKINYGLIEGCDDEELANSVRQIFANQRYLVVVDCLCNMNSSSWAYIKDLLPDSNVGSRIILVSRSEKFFNDDFIFYYYEKSFLKARPSWELLRQQVFADDSCPRELVEIGKRIAYNCQGLPLAIITTGIHLAREQKTIEYWNKVAKSGNAIAYAADGALMFEQLGLSYKQLPQDLRPIFLYIGAFQEAGIYFTELQTFWVAEGFVPRAEYKIFKDLTYRWLKHLRDMSLVYLTKFGTWDFCALHHAFWHFCCHKAEKEEFFHVMDKYTDWEDSPLGLNRRNIRRLIIRNISLLGIIDVCKLKHPALSSIRSLLFTGPYHRYPLRVFLRSYKMLRVLNASSIRFYEFPTEVLYLSLLRSLYLTLNRGELPSRISNLRSLQFLIIHLHQTVISFGGTPSYLPVEIWEMQQLIHLQVMGSDLPAPPNSDALLPNLLTLRCVSSHSCTTNVLERIPNLTELLIWIDLAPTNDAPSSCAFDHLALLQKLEWLDCRITTPYFEGHPKPHVVAMPRNVSVSMNSLAVLILSGCGFPWESIEQISLLPSLEMLELRFHAFRGPKWELTREQTNKGFKRLRALLLEDLDLVYWTGSIYLSPFEPFFPCLTVLKIIQCHKLQKICYDFARCKELQIIEIINSSREAESWSRLIQRIRSDSEFNGNIFVHCSSIISNTSLWLISSPPPIKV